MSARAFTLLAMCAASLAAGCNDLSRFSTQGDEAYCGSIALAGAFRAGFTPLVQMRLTFDASKLDSTEPPGVMSTYEAPSDPRGAPTRLIDDAPLRPLPAIMSDPLSHLDFGDGRERNAIFGVTASSPDVDPFLAVVSLKTDESIEVRLLRPGLSVDPTADPAGRRASFGIFPLTKQENQCGF